MTAPETQTPPPAPPAAPPLSRSLDAIDVSVLRAKWSQLAGEVGRDLESGNSVTVARSMQQLANLEAYIALVESHQHAHRPKWRQWEFWRRIILALAIVLTLTLLFMAFTHPARVEARFDLRTMSVAFRCDGDLRLSLGNRFESMTVTGLDRVSFPDKAGERVIDKPELIVSTDRTTGGRADWMYIAAGSMVRLGSSGRELSLRISSEPRRGEATPINAMPAVRFTANPGGRLMVSSGRSEFSEQDIALGDETRAAAIEGICTALPARIEVTILLAADEIPRGGSLTLGRFSGADISSLACTSDDLVTGARRSTLLGGEIAFPEIEVPHVELDEASPLAIRDLTGTLVRVEIDHDGVRLRAEGTVSDIRAGRDGDRSLLPSRLESLFARRFRMYVTGVLLYAIVFIVALLKGEKQSIGEGFRPHSLMGMVHGGGHL